MQQTPTRPRALGSHGSAHDGRTLVAIGGLHGNEPAGVSAIERVLATMTRSAIRTRGQFVGLIGNRTALAAGRRCLQRDLNRGWSTRSCATTARARSEEPPEDREQRELWAAIATTTATANGPVVFLDLHSMSGPGAPFSIAPDLLRNRHLSVPLPVPTVLGLEEIIEGTLLGHLCDQGHIGLAIEGGQHQAPDTTELLEACVWFGLVAAGILKASDVPDHAHKISRLRRAAAGLPSLVEIKHRHAVAAGDGFSMKPGYENFVAVRKGETLAHDRRGPIPCPRDGLMMLPRYQTQGDDGFFIAKPVTVAWLHASAAARRAGLDRWLWLLPGLTRGASDHLRYRGQTPPRALLSVLHLLGYRGVRPLPVGLEFFRRRQR